MHRSCVRILDGRWVWHESRWRSWWEGRVPAGRWTSSAGHPLLPRFPQSSSGLWAAQKPARANVFKTVGVTVILFLGENALTPTFGGSGGGVWSAGAMKLWTERVLKQPGAWASWCGCFSSPDVFHCWTEDKRKIMVRSLITSDQLYLQKRKYDIWYIQWAADVWFFSYISTSS